MALTRICRYRLSIQIVIRKTIDFMKYRPLKVRESQYESYPRALHLSVVCKLKALSCSEVSSSSMVGAGEAGEAAAERGGLASSPRSMLGARIRISGTLISLNLRLWTPRNSYNLSSAEGFLDCFVGTLKVSVATDEFADLWNYWLFCNKHDT